MAKINSSSARQANIGEMDATDSDTFDEDDLQEFGCEWPNTDLDPDLFGLSICSLVRDFFLLAKKKGDPINRYSRVVSTLGILIICLYIQVFLLAEVKRFVSAKAVHDIRIAYDKYEDAMYGGRTTVMSTKPVVERRGIGGVSGPYFNISNFDSLSSDEQAAACRIPLSQPVFFWLVLYIWSLVCIIEIRKTKDLFLSLIVNTETCESMANSLEDEDAEPGGEFVVARLTLGMKVALILLVLLPRLGITCYLLWLGCRWLLATTNFADLILNSMALEFILCLKDVLFLALASRRSTIDLENTNIVPATKQEPESMAMLIGTITWGMVCAFWVTGYMGFHAFGYNVNGMQQVLRDYQWDIHHVCSSWIDERYAV